jgi:hypothetical protein
MTAPGAELQRWIRSFEAHEQPDRLGGQMEPLDRRHLSLASRAPPRREDKEPRLPRANARSAPATDNRAFPSLRGNG